jgi:hypothetical protein
MRYRFNGSIPSKKNFKSRFNPKVIKDFEKSVKLQFRQKHYHLIEIIKSLPRPLRVVLHITKYRDDSWDFDNKATTVQDVMFGFNKKKQEYIGIFPVDDDYREVLFYPGELRIDKINLKTNADDFFEIEFVKNVIYESFS